MGQASLAQVEGFQGQFAGLLGVHAVDGDQGDDHAQEGVGVGCGADLAGQVPGERERLAGDPLAGAECPRGVGEDQPACGQGLEEAADRAGFVERGAAPGEPACDFLGGDLAQRGVPGRDVAEERAM